jgi:hypothetical protein
MGNELLGVSVTLKTGSPVWVEVPITISKPFNLLKFDYEFLSTAGAQGVVTAFVDDHLVYKIDERSADPRLNTTQDIPVGDLFPGQHTVGFRLDPFTAVQSAVRISDIQLGLAKQTDPSVTDSDLDALCIHR